jgi:hypothetical protein
LDICRQMYLSIASNKLLKMTIFCNARYATDISIHLQWKSNPGDESVLGISITEALGNLGLISHTLWVEQEDLAVGQTLVEGLRHDDRKDNTFRR